MANHTEAVRYASLKSGQDRITVRKIIADDKSYEAFLKFCTKEWCGENPRFLKAVQHHETLVSDVDRLRDARQIIHDFFSEECKHVVSLPAAKMHRLMERSKSDTICASGTLFDEANKMIEREVSLDVFKRFLNSATYRSLFEKKVTQSAAAPKPPVLMTASQSLDSRSFYRRFMRERINPSRCEARYKGWLEKKGGPYSFTGWKRRWVVLRHDYIFYFTPSQANRSGDVRPQGQIAVSQIRGLMKTRTNRGMPCFSIEMAKRRYDFKASSAMDRDMWYEKVRAAWKKA